jgi:hypothetical protein
MIKSFGLQHDNAPAYTALSVLEFLPKNCIPVLPQAPYSPDLSPCSQNYDRESRDIIFKYLTAFKRL